MSIVPSYACWTVGPRSSPWLFELSGDVGGEDGLVAVGLVQQRGDGDKNGKSSSDDHDSERQV